MVDVTVVVAAHNAARWLAETLESVVAQTLTDWHCHVVDDGSTDGTAAIAGHYSAVDSRFSVLEQRNAGVSAARNRLLRSTRGDSEYVAVLDADDVWLPDALAVMTAALDEDPEAVGVQSLAEYIDEDSSPIRSGAHPAVQRRKFDVVGGRVVPATFGSGMGFRQMLVTSGLYPPASMLFRRSALDAVGGYDETYRSQVDWDMYLRMVAAGGHFAELDVQTAWYRIRAGNLTGDRGKVAVNQARLLRSAWERTPPASQDRRAVEVAYRHRQRASVRTHLRQGRGAVTDRRWGDAVANGALTALLATRALARRPMRSRAALDQRVGRTQGRLWQAGNSGGGPGR